MIAERVSAYFNVCHGDEVRLSTLERCASVTMEAVRCRLAQGDFVGQYLLFEEDMVVMLARAQRPETVSIPPLQRVYTPLDEADKMGEIPDVRIPYNQLWM